MGVPYFASAARIVLLDAALMTAAQRLCRRGVYECIDYVADVYQASGLPAADALRRAPRVSARWSRFHALSPMLDYLRHPDMRERLRPVGMDDGLMAGDLLAVASIADRVHHAAIYRDDLAVYHLPMVEGCTPVRSTLRGLPVRAAFRPMEAGGDI